MRVGLQFSGGSILSGVLNVAGMSAQSALLTVGNTTINNTGSYRLVLEGDAFSGDGSVFHNSGTLTAHATTEKVTFDIPLHNTGTVAAESGTFALTGGGTFSGIASAASGAILQFGSDFTITDGTQFIGLGTVQFNKPSVTTLSGTITNNTHIVLKATGSFADFVLNGNVTFTGSGTLSLVDADLIRGNGIFTNAGTTIDGETSNFGSFGNNEIGIINQAGGVISANVSGRALNLDPGPLNGLINRGTMLAVDGGILHLNGNGGGTFTNSGTIRARNGTLEFSGVVISTGTVDVASGALHVTGSFTQNAGTFFLTGGTVTSTSALNFAGGLVNARGTIDGGILNNARLQPALGGSGLGVDGNITLLAASQLSFQLGGLTQGSQYGYLDVNGTMSIGGQLVVSFVSGFQNAVESSDEFTLLSASSVGLGGLFTNVAPGARLETSDGFGSFQVDYDATQIVLSNFVSERRRVSKFRRPRLGDRRRWQRTQPHLERAGFYLWRRCRGISWRFLQRRKRCARHRFPRW